MKKKPKHQKRRIIPKKGVPRPQSMRGLKEGAPRPRKETQR